MNRFKVLLVAIIAVVVSCNPVFALSVGDKAPSFEAVTLSGKSVSLAETKDAKALVMIFWATWCPYCEVALPIFKEAYAKYGAAGVRFLAINTGLNDSLRKVELYAGKHEIPYPVVYDEKGAISRLFGIRGVPTVFILDAEGIIRYIGNEVGPDLGDIIGRIVKPSDEVAGSSRPDWLASGSSDKKVPFP